MTWKFPAANKLAVLLAASAVVAVSFDITPASAQSRRQYDDRGRPYYGPNGPNVSYQQGPRTRIYVTKRSWLDAGTEVLPGERKFTDYAYPPELGYPSFALRRKMPRPRPARGKGKRQRFYARNAVKTTLYRDVPAFDAIKNSSRADQLCRRMMRHAGAPLLPM